MGGKQTIGRAAACSLLALGAVIGLSSQASAATTFGSVEVATNSSADADPSGLATNTSSSSVSTGQGDSFTTSFPSASVTALSFTQADSFGFGSDGVYGIQSEASDLETAQANFASASGGTAEFVGSTTAKVLASGADAFATSAAFSYYVYDFTVDHASIVTVDYNTTSDTALPGFAPGYSIYVYNGSATYLDDEGIGNNTANSVSSFTFGPGSYSLEIDDSPGNDLSTATDVITPQDASALGEFGFAITAVPEPATWSMMLIGFGAMGAALRSRRKPATTTA